MTAGISNSNIYNISPQEVKDRLKLLNQDTPVIYLTSLVKEPQEITLRTVARNNIMLDKVLENQEIIINNQKEILNKLGNNIDYQA
ncbi:MAG: hypothetical protein E7Z89_00115 [Cyanobacteria bacterium SIG28]|nr:hypothetical protein [Cyanobacteria bacterium SIG28]